MLGPVGGVYAEPRKSCLVFWVCSRGRYTRNPSLDIYLLSVHGETSNMYLHHKSQGTMDLTSNKVRESKIGPRRMHERSLPRDLIRL